MTLKKYSLTEIDVWEGMLLQATLHLRAIRQGMLEEEVDEIDLEATKAADNIEYLSDWAMKAEAKYKQGKARRHAKKAQELMKKLRSKN